MPTYVDVEQSGLMDELRLLRRLVATMKQRGIGLPIEGYCSCPACSIWREWDERFGPTAKAKFKSMCKMCGNPGGGTVELEDAGCPVTLCVDCADREGLSALLVPYPRIDNRGTTV